MSTADQFVAVNALHPDAGVLVLQETRDFWDDRAAEVVEAAQTEIDAAHDALAAELTARWGDPTKVELWPYLEDDDAQDPMLELSQLSGSMLVWHRGAGGWVALAVGQADAEFPIQLLAAAGTAELPS
ncbi:hypothetical protein [Allokutzneria albata]|uniref:Uncharacterized protein n=1 Tax=Allokutzneria albata TaxID=211114 RepID=A0A1G9SKU3_ALLAB|nr:hypothetical protein [Allokutzneria albata]SDM36133.1 hypothetical protein SAMN04489726_1246 [Allokutzneria albata]